MVLILGPLVMLGSLSTDLYLPAFPEVTAELGTSRELVQLSIAASLVGVAAGQLVGGAWSDAVGRRVPLLLGTGVHIAASIGVALAGDIGTLLLFRVIQGAGAACASVVATALARDLVSGSLLVRLLARLALFSGLAPVVAPFLGALLLHAFHWRGLFVTLAVYGAVVALVCLLALPETHVPSAVRSGQRERYRAVLQDREFLGAAVMGAMACTGVFAYVSAAPFVLQDGFGLNSDGFAVVFAINASAFALGSQLASRIVTKSSPSRALKIALPTWLIAAIVMLGVDVLDGPMLLFVASAFVFLAAAGVVLPVVQVLGLAKHGAQAGTAASLLGAANFAVAGLLAPLATFAAPSPVAALGLALAAAGAISATVYVVLVRRRGEA